MQHFILSIIATISLISLVIYDFICICLIINKEEFVEKIHRQIFPKKEYNEKRVLLIIRPILLNISFITYVLSGGILSKIAIYNLILMFTPILAFLVLIINIKKDR